ncbi:MAG TPA: AAA family ATPase [Chitinivibrionales bacterium]|nr:AAA family ATPase [Chitinivibrionales bacterium]
MPTIALTGKGGTGKTTIAALMVRWLVANGKTPVLAVDADSNANFNEMLGLSYSATVGGVREDTRSRAGSLGNGLSKQQFLEAQVNHALVESEGFDLIVMGRPEGPGCYCFANNVLRDVLARIAKNYPSIVVDCEAGLEHLSRRTLLAVDWLVTVSDPSIRGLRTAKRVGELVDEMKTRVRRRALVINMFRGASGKLTDAQRRAVDESGFDRVFMLPYDETIKNMDENAGTIKDIGDKSGIYSGMAEIMEKLFQ